MEKPYKIKRPDMSCLEEHKKKRENLLSIRHLIQNVDNKYDKETEANLEKSKANKDKMNRQINEFEENKEKLEEELK